MSKRCWKKRKERLTSNSVSDGVKYHKTNQKTLINFVIGLSNVKRWNEIKYTLCCKTNEDFVKLLLDIAQEHIHRNNIKHHLNNPVSREIEDLLPNKENDDNSEILYSKAEYESKQKSRLEGNQETNEENAGSRNTDNLTCNSAKQDSLLLKTENVTASKNDVECLSPDFNLEIKTENGEKDICNEEVPSSFVLKPSAIDIDAQPFSNIKDRVRNRKRKELFESSETFHRKAKSRDKKNDKVKKKTEIDVRKAPDFSIQIEKTTVDSVLNDEKQEKIEENNKKIAVKIKLCCSCNTKHVQDCCPLQNPEYIILDSCSYEEWKKKYAEVINQSELELKDEENGTSFACASLPQVLCFNQTNTLHGMGVSAKIDLNEFTQFGPLIGKLIKEVDVSEDCNMRHLWDVVADSTHTYVNTEDIQESNWIRFVRPAPTREDKNLLSVLKNNCLFLITTKSISAGEELLYWQDDVIITNKKKIEKTNCGGCNMNFIHPIYYRIHCSIFHDTRYSLTIRKYHCKVCGTAVLGKENIMKHAAELHNGQGAYQCQFCKKFFLRLNYLEMHRTYGCSANPHRSRPLCDFCGRKFCQPQKLKVHIKRMHSDMSEVLKEFQCKNCLKILGSRAALQRHLKEVHQKQLDGACACNKCGKTFQNKSNLKIHMLTHSGVKPFKCAEKNCTAAFTTKQCLQFHYKKVHGLTEDSMPKIERSVDYTFEAYSGQDDNEGGTNPKAEVSMQKDNRFDYSCITSETDESLDCKNLDDPLALSSPIPIETNELSSGSNPSPPTLEAYTPNMKLLSKGSKKWISDEPFHKLKNDIYQFTKNRSCKTEESTNILLDLKDPQTYEQPKLTSNLNIFARHESSNASLLVEAALDSVCSEPNIDIDVNSTTNCTDALVHNLYTLSHVDTLPDVTYSHSIDMSESRDINLISPSVNDHISVTDDMNEDLSHNQNIGLDYSSFRQEDFSPPNSPNIQARNNFVRDYINGNVVSPQDPQNYETAHCKNESPIASPLRYDFDNNVNADHISSDDSSGLGVQNLSTHNTKDSIQLDLSIYKPHNIDSSNFQLRKDFRIKFDNEIDRKQVYVLDSDNLSKSYTEEAPNIPETSDQIQGSNVVETNKNLEDLDVKHKDVHLESTVRSNLSDVRNKFDIDLDLRIKSYENINHEARTRNPYDGTIDDFRIKNYDLIENLETRTNFDGRSLLDSDFRTDRNFEHLMLNSSELQGLDMSARSYHNYSNLNRYHHLYSDVDRTSVDLRLNYSPPPPTYTHADILRVVSLDLTSPGRHSVDLSLRSHQIANSRLLSEHGTPHRLALDQGRFLPSELTTTRHLNPESRLISVPDISSRILSDHTTNRLLSNAADQRLVSDETRLLSDQSRLLDQGRLLNDGRILPPVPNSGTISPVPYAGYSVSPSSYHASALPSRPHAPSPNAAPYHHYSVYY